MLADDAKAEKGEAAAEQKRPEATAPAVSPMAQQMAATLGFPPEWCDIALEKCGSRDLNEAAMWPVRGALPITPCSP